MTEEHIKHLRNRESDNARNVALARKAVDDALNYLVVAVRVQEQHTKELFDAERELLEQGAR